MPQGFEFRVKLRRVASRFVGRGDEREALDGLLDVKD